MSKQVERFSAMARAAELVNTTPSAEAALEAVMDVAIRTVGAERGFIMLIDPDSGDLVARVHRRCAPGLSRTLVLDVFRSQEPYFNLDVGSDSRYGGVASVRAHALRAVMCVPLQVHGRRVGVLYLDNRVKSGAFEPDDLAFAVAFSHQAALALDRAQLSDMRREHGEALAGQQRDAMGTLAAGMAHEINNPLGTILANAQLMIAPGPEDRASLDGIVDGVRQAQRVVQRLLTWFRAGTDEDVRRVELLSAVRELALLSTARPVVSGVEGLWVDCRPTSLAQIVGALLDNAVKAVRGCPEPAIDIRVEPPAMVVVEDNGPGIALDILPRVFDPFFTTDPPGGGQGLGLFVARSLAARDHAQLAIESRPGRTRVSLRYG